MSPVTTQDAAPPGPDPWTEDAQKTALRRAILAWYDAHARILPWRIGPADRRARVRPDPYRVWLSEIMLQQTTTPHAAPYFRAFTTRWPTVGDLAAADDGAVMSAWAGLGYYARARNLLACARTVARAYQGVFPEEETGLLALPGVGAYTAAAVAAIAFDKPANVVDGNVERVISRLFAVEEALPAAKPTLKRLAGALVGKERPGDWAQALMDLGAVVCMPKTPLCDSCPASGFCHAFRRGDPSRFPRKVKKAERPRRFGVAYILAQGGQVALVRRPPKGMLGGMLALPTSAWGAARLSDTEAVMQAPVAADWRAAGEIEHVFTHFALTLRVLRAEAGVDLDGAIWTPVEKVDGLPSVFLKALRKGLGARL
jgi:A/G-specific adenine glycosylase